ncbi:MAG: hypothetical protein ACI9TZ_003257, partial [Yoonia sp.]
CVMSVRCKITRMARFLKRYTAVFVDINGAQGRNRTTDTRIFKTCVLNKYLKIREK